MAGIKQRKGTQVWHGKNYINGQEWRPCKVVTRKILGNGYKTYMAAQSVQTGEMYRNTQGRIAPWHSIPFTCIKPENLND